MKEGKAVTRPSKRSRASKVSESVGDRGLVLHVPDGRFTRATDVIPSTSQNLIVVLGKSETGDSVLLPYVELRLDRKGISEEDVREPLAATVTLDNASFLIMDVCRDFARVSDEFARLCSDRYGLDAVRAEYILGCLIDAEEAIRRGIAAFEKVRTPEEEPSETD